jgi:hypothetical protein
MIDKADIWNYRATGGLIYKIKRSLHNKKVELKIKIKKIT